MAMILILIFFISIYVLFKSILARKSESIGCLIGKTAIVTGGNSGLGFGTCCLLAARGCRIIIADRDNAEKTIEKIIKKTGNPNISYKFLDLSSLKTVRKFAEEIEKNEVKIDILINNAGVGDLPLFKTEDGLNAVMQINYFGAFLLTHLLLKRLKASPDARVVFTGSQTTYFYTHKIEDMNPLERNEVNYSDSLQVYSFSKVCNVLAAQEFAKKLTGTNITFYSIDPNAVKSAIFQRFEEVNNSSFIKIVHRIMLIIMGQEPLICAQTTLDIVTNEKSKYDNGGYFCCMFPFYKTRQLNNQEFCDGIWKKSEDFVKLKPDEKISE